MLISFVYAAYIFNKIPKGNGSAFLLLSVLNLRMEKLHKHFKGQYLDFEVATGCCSSWSSVSRLINRDTDLLFNSYSFWHACLC